MEKSISSTNYCGHFFLSCIKYIWDKTARAKMVGLSISQQTEDEVDEVWIPIYHVQHISTTQYKTLSTTASTADVCFFPTAQNNLLCSLVGWIEQLITQNLTDLFDLFNNVLMLCFSRKLANADQSSYTHTRTCSQTKTLINVIITNHYLRQMSLLSVNAVLHLCFQIFNFRQVNKWDYIFH